MRSPRSRFMKRVSRAGRSVQRMFSSPRPPAESRLPGQFQPYSHTLPNRYPWLFEFAAANLAIADACRLLSFGCSRGDEVFALREYFPAAEIKGIDIAPENIEICRARTLEKGIAGISFTVASNTRAEPSEYYHAIFCLAVLCHGDLSARGAKRSDPLISFAEFSSMVGDFSRSLKPGGLLLLLTTNFRFCDTEASRDFDTMLEAEPERLAPDVLFGRDNRLMPGEQYRAVAFRKRTASRGAPAFLDI
jgi:SAM-dependent methyltransferase